MFRNGFVSIVQQLVVLIQCFFFFAWLVIEMHNSPRPSHCSHSYSIITLQITSSVIHTLAPKAYIFHTFLHASYSRSISKSMLYFFYFFYLTTTFDKQCFCCFVCLLKNESNKLTPLALALAFYRDIEIVLALRCGYLLVKI